MWDSRASIAKLEPCWNKFKYIPKCSERIAWVWRSICLSKEFVKHPTHEPTAAWVLTQQTAHHKSWRQLKFVISEEPTWCSASILFASYRCDVVSPLMHKMIHHETEEAKTAYCLYMSLQTPWHHGTKAAMILSSISVVVSVLPSWILLIVWYSWKTDELSLRVTSTFFYRHELFRFFVRSAFAELGLVWRMVVPQKIQLADLLELPTSQTYQRGQDTVPMPRVAFSVLPAPANKLVFLPKGACPMEQETLFKTFSVASLRSFCGTTDPENSKGFQWAQRRQLPLTEALLRMKRFKLLIQRSFLAVRIHSFTSLSVHYHCSASSSILGLEPMATSTWKEWYCIPTNQDQCEQKIKFHDMTVIGMHINM